MKRFVVPFFVFLTFFISSCSLLQQAKEYKRFVQCDFSLGSVQIDEIGGINISAFENPEQLGMLAVMSLTQQLFNGSIPSKFTITIKATNNSAEKAAVAGFDWILEKQEEQLLSGTLDQPVEVSPNGENSFTINTEIDILKLFRSKSLDTLLGFVFSDNKEKELSNLGITIRIRPYYKLGSSVHKYPGFLTIPL
jgi:hypothetical protein